MVQDHKPTAQNLGKAIKLFGKQNILNFKKASAEKNLRSRRDHGTSFNPCFIEERLLMINQTYSVKQHVCYNTTNVGCSPVNGKYLCEKVLTVYKNSAGKEEAYTSGCRCVNP